SCYGLRVGLPLRLLELLLGRWGPHGSPSARTGTRVERCGVACGEPGRRHAQDRRAGGGGAPRLWPGEQRGLAAGGRGLPGWPEAAGPGGCAGCWWAGVALVAVLLHGQGILDDRATGKWFFWSVVWWAAGGGWGGGLFVARPCLTRRSDAELAARSRSTVGRG